MTSYYPPTTNFPNINFNNDFFAIPNNNQGITLAYANTHYLFSTGVANSSAISTFFTGGVGIGVASGTAGSLNAITINGTELQISGVNVSNIFITSNVLGNVLTSYISSNVLSNVLTPYDTIALRTTAINNLSNLYISSNVLGNVLIPYDTIALRTTAINNLSNNLISTSNGLITIINNTSNDINTNTNNNFSKISRVFIPNTLFVYDTTNSCYTYDLDISKYINYDLVYGGLGNPIYFKTRIFKINSYMSTDWLNLDFNNKNHLSGNAICFPETLTIFMSNNYHYNNIHTAPDNYCNGIILGKLNEKSSGYWNIIPNNFNYIRFISAQGFDMKIIIQPLTQN